MKKKPVDWSAIEAEYRAGQIAVKELARRFGTHENQIRRNAKKYGWKRSLADVVRAGVKDAVVRDMCAKSSARTKTDEQVIEHAVKRGAGAVQGHLARAEKLKGIADRMIENLTVHLAPQGKKSEIFRMLLGKSDGFANLVRASGELADRIQKLERQALSLDDDAKKDDTPVNVHMNYAGRA